jgi:rubrerythrin
MSIARNKAREDLKRELKRLDFRPRKVDLPALSDMLKKARREDAVRSYEDERRRRRSMNLDENIPPALTQRLGGQTINDIPSKDTWQGMYYDQTGKVAGQYGKPYVCPKCGTRWHQAWPPDRCICGKLSPIMTNEVNLRR